VTADPIGQDRGERRTHRFPFRITRSVSENAAAAKISLMKSYRMRGDL
jgi:hypothetical protein